MQKLEKEINIMKNNLIQVAQERGLNSNDTVGYSQELDELIVRYQKMSSQKRGNNLQL